MKNIIKINEPMECKHCAGRCIKKGVYGKNKIQRYQCKVCRKYQQLKYMKCRIVEEKFDWVQKLNNEGCGISSISRLLQVAKSSVQRIIIRLASRICKPSIMMRKSYEVDELRTFVGNKDNQIWVAYSLRKDTGEITDITVGKRSNKTLRRVVDTLLLSNAKQIFTDKLSNYLSLIPKTIHNTTRFGTNHIERMNLNLRIGLKRLNRRSICFSRDITMLECCLKLYCWGK